MEEKLDADGFFATPTGDTIYKEEFKGVWLAGNIPPLSWDFFNLEQKSNLKLHKTTTAGIYEITIPLSVRREPMPYLSEWKIEKENPDYPTIKTSMPIIDALYNMSINDVSNGIINGEDGKRCSHARPTTPE